MSWRAALDMLGLLIVYNLITFYIGWNVWAFLELIFPLHLVFFILVMTFFAYSIFIGSFVHALKSWRLVGYLWFGFVQYAIVLFPVANLAYYLLTLGSFSSEIVILSVGVVTVAIMIGIFSYGVFNAYSPVVREYSITIAKRVPTRKKMRIVMASDMHFGTFSGRTHLDRLVTTTNELKPDLILLPGDIIDDDPKVFIQKKMGERLAKLKAPLGVFGVLGNHEYYGRKIPEYIEEMNKIHVKILLDEVLYIEEGQLCIVGRKDKTDRNRMSFAELLEDVDLSIPIIAMDHQPYELKQAEAAGVDLLLSGHTHRGQMAPNHLITKRIFELDWGYKQKNRMHAVVSSGFGFWGPPLRVGSRSEIVCINITFE